jgi:hypothetical protein
MTLRTVTELQFCPSRIANEIDAILDTFRGSEARRKLATYQASLKCEEERTWAREYMDERLRKDVDQLTRALRSGMYSLAIAGGYGRATERVAQAGA